MGLFLAQFLLAEWEKTNHMTNSETWQLLFTSRLTRSTDNGKTKSLASDKVMATDFWSHSDFHKGRAVDLDCRIFFYYFFCPYLQNDVKDMATVVH